MRAALCTAETDLSVRLASEGCGDRAWSTPRSTKTLDGAETPFCAEEGPGKRAGRKVGTLEEVWNELKASGESQGYITHAASELRAMLGR